MRKFGLSKTQIQLIAITCMTLDHIAWAFWPGYSYEWPAILFHIVGRITAPVMWFFIAEGYDKTKNIGKYALRLLIFAIISHFAFNFFEGTSFNPLMHYSILELTSVIWGLLGGLAGIFVIEHKKLSVFLKILFTVLICALTLGADWNILSPLAIIWIHLNKGKFKRQAAGVAILAFLFAFYMFMTMDRLYGVLQLCVCLSLPLIYFYNGQKGRNILGKYFFYIYYPVHLVLIGLLRFY